jgi:hypothetical protein
MFRLGSAHAYCAWNTSQASWEHILPPPTEASPAFVDYYVNLDSFPNDTYMEYALRVGVQ